MQQDSSLKENDHLLRYLVFTREEWAQLRGNTPLTLSEERLLSLRSLNDRLSLHEVEQIYLPLSRLFHLYVAAVQQLHAATATFLGYTAAQVPYVIGIAGSVAVGKSTTACLSVEKAIATARSIWQEINSPNLRENILPTRERAHLILHKGNDHSIQEVRLRKL